MSWPDAVNGCFESVAGCLLWTNVRELQRTRIVVGVRILPTALFALWGVWNLFYYPSLGQWWSFLGGGSVVVANTVWVFLAIKYGRQSKGC